MTATNYKGPLAGVKVIDFGWYYAGAMTGMLLADQGAEVIRIVKPGDRELPDQQYRVLNRNKKLLVLDLKTEEGREQALALIEKADVLIENFRPGVMKRLGLDYASVKGVNPGLVYLSLPGFASTDKERAHLQAWEGVMGAASGVYTDTNQFREYLDFPPVYTWVPQCSMYGAMMGGIAIMAALTGRQRTGQGTVIETPMADAALMGFSFNVMIQPPFWIMRSLVPAKAPLPKNLRPLKYQSGDSVAEQRRKLQAARFETRESPTKRMYLCADNRFLYLYTQDVGRFVEKIIQVLGIADQLKAEGFVVTGPWVKGLDNNLCDAAGMPGESVARFEQLIAEALLTKPAEEWEMLLHQQGVPNAVVRTREEWLALEPLLKTQLFVSMDDGNRALTVPGRLGDMSDAKGRVMPAHFHEPDQIDINSASKAFDGFPQPMGNDARGIVEKKSDLLKGLKVLDLSNVAAGPVSANILAEYGADVIKADPPSYLFPALVVGSIPILSGKRSILTDVSKPEGREVLTRLIKWADVIVHNSVDETASRLGVTLEQVQVINPAAVTCQISAYGATERGGWENRTGFDCLLQASSGLMAQYGSIDDPYWHGMISCGDIMGGFALAFVALLGAYQQRGTGKGGEGRTSLARLISYVQLPYMIAENGRSDWGEARGQFAVGESWHQQLYQCEDGWVFVGAHDRDTGLLLQTVLDDNQLSEPALEETFKRQPCSIWVEKLNKAGIGCHRVMSVDAICKETPMRPVDNTHCDEQASESLEILRWDNHPWRVPVDLPAPNWVRVGENHSWTRLKTAPRLGENTREILAELGYSKNEINHLIEIGASHEYLTALDSKNIYFLGQEQE